MKWEKLKDSWVFWIGLLLSFVGLYRLFIRSRNRRPDYSKKEQEPKKTPFQVKKPESKADIDRLIRKHMKFAGYGSQMQDIAVGVARLESADYTSNVFQANNNMFGMKYPHERATLSTGEKGGYANYETIEDSVEDYILYLGYFGYPMEIDPVAYVEKAAGVKYFSVPGNEYLNGLNAEIKKSKYSK